MPSLCTCTGLPRLLKMDNVHKLNTVRMSYDNMCWMNTNVGMSSL